MFSIAIRFQILAINSVWKHLDGSSDIISAGTKWQLNINQKNICIRYVIIHQPSTLTITLNVFCLFFSCSCADSGADQSIIKLSWTTVHFRRNVVNIHANTHTREQHIRHLITGVNYHCLDGDFGHILSIFNSTKNIKQTCLAGSIWYFFISFLLL